MSGLAPFQIAFALPSIAAANSTNTLTTPCRAIYVGNKGNAKFIVKGQNGVSNTAIFTSLNAGQIYDIRAYAVLTSNTTAGNILALY